MMVCTQCGSPLSSEREACGVCGHSERTSLVFTREDGVNVPVGRLALSLNQNWARNALGADGRAWATDWQCRVEPSGGAWTITHNDEAPNQTLVDGKAVRAATLSDGMVVSVGREVTGVSKTPLVVRLVR